MTVAISVGALPHYHSSSYQNSDGAWSPSSCGSSPVMTFVMVVLSSLTTWGPIYCQNSAYSRSDSNRHLMSPVVGTKPVVLVKLVNPYLLPRALGFVPRVFHVRGSTPTFQHWYTFAHTFRLARVQNNTGICVPKHMYVCMYQDHGIHGKIVARSFQVGVWLFLGNTDYSIFHVTNHVTFQHFL